MSDEESRDPRKSAAIVYDDGVAVDELLLVFARDLVDLGVRIGGVLQLPRRAEGCGPDAPMRVCDIATGEEMAICTRVGADECALDFALLRGAAERVRAATDSGVELILVSRFGRAEMRGAGFSAALVHAARRGRPVLTAVRRGHADRWIASNGGTATLLDARLWVLKNWWAELVRTQAHAA